MEHKVVNTEGKEVGSAKLNENIFNQKVNSFLVHDTVRWQRARARAGTHSCLRKDEVSGGGKKPWAQKGTGRARCGSNTSPLWVGGGVSFGPKPRDYDFRLSKRARRQALISTLSEKQQAKQIIVVDKLELASGKTKDAAKMLKKLGVKENDKQVLMLISNAEHKAAESLIRAMRNVPNVDLRPVEGVNVLSLLKSALVVASQEALKELEARLVK